MVADDAAEPARCPCRESGCRRIKKHRHTPHSAAPRKSSPMTSPAVSPGVSWGEAAAAPATAAVGKMEGEGVGLLVLLCEGGRVGGAVAESAEEALGCKEPVPEGLAEERLPVLLPVAPVLLPVAVGS